MATVADVTTAGLRNLGVIDASEGYDGTEATQAREMLNDMLSEWDAAGVKIGHTNYAADSEIVRLSPYMLAAVKYGLSVYMAPQYQITPDEQLLARADASYRNMLIANQSRITVEYPSTLPIGSGNECDYDVYYDQSFFHEGSKENF